MYNAYLCLAGAILAEVTGTTLLKLADGFEQPLFGVGAVGLYLVSFYFVGMSLVELPVGVVYATWSAVGIVGLAAIGIVVFNEPVDIPGIVGFGLVIAGVVVLNVTSGSYAPA